MDTPSNTFSTLTSVAVDPEDVFAGSLSDGVSESAELSGIEVVGMGGEDDGADGGVLFHRLQVARSRECRFVVIHVAHHHAHSRQRREPA